MADFRTWQLTEKWTDVLLAQHRSDVSKAMEHGVLRERARNQAQLAAKSSEVDQARQELAEVRSWLASLLQERDELRLSASIELSRWIQANDRAHRTEGEWNVLLVRVQKAKDE